MFKCLSIFTLVAMLSFDCFCQFPCYFNYNIDTKSPSNEVYSTFQDKEGYLWIGCDAGLFRFNGVQFEQFSSTQQSSRSVTGVSQSSSGKIFAYNFNNQLMYVENGKLSVVKKWNFPINHIVADHQGNVWISSFNGLFCLSDKTLNWKEIKDLDGDGKKESYRQVTNVQTTQKGTIYYSYKGYLIALKKNKKQVHILNLEHPEEPFFITSSMSIPWVFSIVNGAVFKPFNNSFTPENNKKLTEVLKGRKITNTQYIAGDIWISTYCGIVRYQLKTKKAQVFYPQFAFSSCLKDTEGNYWFSTLNNGILRVPNLSILTWNYQESSSGSDLFSHILTTKNKLFTATTDGVVGEMNLFSKEMNYAENDLKSDVGAVFFDSEEATFLFNKMNTIFAFKNKKLIGINQSAHPVKNFYKINNQYILASSQGTFLYSSISTGFKEIKLLLIGWSREIIKSPFNSHLYLATNSGLLECNFKNNELSIVKTFSENQQILSICSSKNRLFYLTFTGEIYSIDNKGKKQLVFKTNENVRPTKLKFNNEKLFLTSNLGLLIYDIKNQKKSLLTTYDGLSSNNIKDISFTENDCWLATGKGFNKVPFSDLKIKNPRGKIVLKAIKINAKKVEVSQLKFLQHNDNLSIQVDGLNYYSQGNYRFAYRFLGDNTDWINVSNTDEEIKIPRLPIGNFTLEMKLVDVNYEDSANILQFQVVVKAPFWQRWWFYFLIIFTVGGVSFFIFKQRVLKLQKKQELKVKQIQLENELRLTQQNALKAQMNPHFLFNVLNSIKGYIYENDKKNATRYLNDFSNLVRKVLDLSSLPSVTLAEELETLSLYVNLESMLIDGDFEYQLFVEESIDSHAIYIPSLLLQPYVENALKHGLRHKTGAKLLSVKITEQVENELLLIEIEDNGIGRKAAEIINERQGKKHQSFATNANEKRLNLLNFEKKNFVGIEIIDKIDANNEAIGTRVLIRINRR